MIHDLTSDISFLYCEFIMNAVHFDNIHRLGRFVKTVLTYFFICVVFYVDFDQHICYHMFRLCAWVLLHTDVNGGSLCAESIK